MSTELRNVTPILHQTREEAALLAAELLRFASGNEVEAE